jgi:hypothetical protein
MLRAYWHPDRIPFHRVADWHVFTDEHNDHHTCCADRIAGSDDPTQPEPHLGADRRVDLGRLFVDLLWFLVRSFESLHVL